MTSHQYYSERAAATAVYLANLDRAERAARNKSRPLFLNQDHHKPTAKQIKNKILNSI